MSRSFVSFRQLVQASQPNLRQCERRQTLCLNSRTPLSLCTAAATTTSQQHRELTISSPRLNHRRMHPDDDRSSINTERSEYTNSGTDNEVASQRSAFDPKNIDPEMQARASGDEVHEAGDEGNPLEVSPANREVSRTLDPMEGGAQRGMDRGPSQRFSPRKGTKVSMAGWTGSGGPQPEKGGKTASGSSGGGSGGKGSA